MTEEEKFWEWFKKNNSKYYFLNQILDEPKKEELLDDFLRHLHEYCNSLFFEIGGIPKEGQELIITAGGNKEYFAKAEQLVSKAPKIDEWEIKALKPPMGIDFVSRYEGVELNPNEIWFLPLDNEEDPKSLGLRICLENYDPKNEELYLNASYQLLDTILGERSAALDISYVEVDRLSQNPKKEGLIELSDLPQYIAWRKTKV